MANSFRKALKHLKSTQITEQPTNSMSKVYAINPPGYDNRAPDKVTSFVPDVDGNWPAGIPGTPGEPTYERPEGVWQGGSNWDRFSNADLSQDSIGEDGTSTEGLIEPDGTVKTLLPPDSRHFILGPLTDGFTLNHVGDAYTNIGYLQKDTRQFVLLGRVTGQMKANLHHESENVPIWDGTSNGFTAYNSNFTLEMAQWFRSEILASRYLSHVPYFYSGGVPQTPQSPADCPTCPAGMKGGNTVGGGGDGGSSKDGSGGGGWGSGGNPNVGEKQGPSEQGDAEDAGYDGSWNKDEGEEGKPKKKKPDRDDYPPGRAGAKKYQDDLDEWKDEQKEEEGKDSQSPDKEPSDYKSPKDRGGQGGNDQEWRDSESKTEDPAKEPSDYTAPKDRGGQGDTDGVDPNEPGLGDKAKEAWDWYVDNKEAVDAAAGSVMNAVDAAMAIASVVGVLIPEAGTSIGGALGIASLTNKVKNVYKAVKAGKTVADGLGGTKTPGKTSTTVKSSDLPDFVNKADGPFTKDSNGRVRNRVGDEVVRPDGTEPSPWKDSTGTSWDGPPGNTKSKSQPKSSGPTKGGGLSGAGSFDVGATGVKKGGFDALNPNQVGPKAQHTGSKGILSPGGGMVYSAPKVGQAGPSAINPGTGAAKYTKHGSNPFSKSSKGGGDTGGVIGSIVHKGNKSIGAIEPQSTQTPAQFNKSSKIFNDIMNGKYQNSPTAQKIYQKGIKAGFTGGSGSINYSSIPKQTSVPNVSKTSGAFSKFASKYTPTKGHLGTFGSVNYESYLIENKSDKKLKIQGDKEDILIMHLLKNPKILKKLPLMIKGLEQERELSDVYGMMFGFDKNPTYTDSYIPQGKVIRESFSKRHVKLIKERKKEFKVPELPKKYKMNFAGKYSSQNTPDVTASKRSDELVASGNAKGQRWRAEDKYWQGYETTERMNVIYDRVGHGEQAWERVIGEARRQNAWKNREIQEQLNIIEHEKAHRKIYEDYESPWGHVIHEGNKDEPVNISTLKDPLLKRVQKRLKKEMEYDDKPSKKGYPNEPPPEMINNWHPKFGKKMPYKKLDPESAKMMPNTGDPDIDVNIERARKKPK